MKAVEHRISSAQFFVMMFVSRIVVTIALNARYLGSENMLEGIVSYVLAMLAVAIISLPVWWLAAKHPELSAVQAARSAMGKWGALIPAVYILYFVLINGASLGLFQIFLADTVNPEFSATVTMAAVVAVAVYGAARGIEAIARCAGCIFAVLLCGTALVFAIVARRFNPENLEPLFTQGFSQTAEGVRLFVARTSLFADMAVLLPMVRGRRVRGFAMWAGGTTLFVSVLLLLLAGCLGPYAATQNFPVYALSAITEVRSMQRLDAVFVGVWLMGFIIKLACDLYACRVCAAQLGRLGPRVTVLVCACAVFVLSLAAAESQSVQRALLDTELLFFCTVITGAVLPLIVLFFTLLKERSGRK